MARPAARDVRPRKPRKQRGVERATRGAARRQEMLNAGADLMRHRGFVGTSVEDVADQLDLTKAAFYYYIRNKEELLFEIATQTLALAREQATRIEHSAVGPQAKLEQLVDAFVRLVAERPAFFTVYFEEKGHLAPPHLKEVTRSERTIVASLEGILQEGMRKRVFRRADATVTAFVIFGMCFWTYKWYRPGGPLSLDEVSRALQVAAIRAVRQGE